MQSVLYWIIRRMLKYSAPLIRMFETKGLRKYGRQDPRAAPVFIIGLPRSGSTFIYQVLTNMFDVSYIDNLMTLGRETLYFSAWLSHLFFRERTHNSYTSTFGNTWEGGLHAPSEAGALWYRWIPEDAIYVDENSLSERNRAAMVLNIKALINRYQKPLVIKNLYFSTRIKLICALFPDAKFIYIRRDPIYIAQSIYLSRMKNSKDPLFEWWSVKFPGYKSFLGKPLEEQVARQVFELEMMLKRDLDEVNPDRIMEVWYKDLDLDNFEAEFRAFIGAQKRELVNREKVVFIPGDKQNADNTILSRLEKELNLLYGTSVNLEING